MRSRSYTTCLRSFQVLPTLFRTTIAPVMCATTHGWLPLTHVTPRRCRMISCIPRVHTAWLQVRITSKNTGQLCATGVHQKYFSGPEYPLGDVPDWKPPSSKL